MCASRHRHPDDKCRRQINTSSRGGNRCRFRGFVHLEANISETYTVYWKKKEQRSELMGQMVLTELNQKIFAVEMGRKINSFGVRSAFS